jgi:hypothetical protein
MYDNILKPKSNPVIAGHIGSFSNALRTAQRAVYEKSTELILESRSDFDRIDKAVSFMCEHASVKSTEERYGGLHYYDEGIILRGKLSVKYYDHSWTDSDGSGKDPRKLIFNEGDDFIEHKIILNTELYESRTSIIRNYEYLLDPNERIDGGMDLVRLNVICSNVKWFASLCEMVVSLLNEKNSKRK